MGEVTFLDFASGMKPKLKVNFGFVYKVKVYFLTLLHNFGPDKVDQRWTKPKLSKSLDQSLTSTSVNFVPQSLPLFYELTRIYEVQK